MQDTSTIRKLSINTLMEEVRPKGMEKWQFEVNVSSELSYSCFGIFGSQDSHAKIMIHYFSIE